MKRGRLPLLWAECMNFCGVGSKYNSLRSHNGLVKKFAKKMSSVLSLELEESTGNYNRGIPAGLRNKTELFSELGDNGFKEIYIQLSFQSRTQIVIVLRMRE